LPSTIDVVMIGELARPTRSLKSAAELSLPAAVVHACHYCQRTAGRPTRDHKVRRKFGGTNVAENIVRCYQMCNAIKGLAVA
jgi:5-methylcytosine-specific restriction endonuclease McrA